MSGRPRFSSIDREIWSLLWPVMLLTLAQKFGSAFEGILVSVNNPAELTVTGICGPYVKGFFAACPCWLASALCTIDGNFGSAEGYILQSTDVTAIELSRFRENCLDAPPGVWAAE